MNIQALMKQAQSLQKDMLKTKEEIEKMEFESKNNFVTIKVNGKKEVLSVKIDVQNLESDDIESLEDMILLAINKAFSDVDKITEEKMGKFSNFPGIF